VTRVVGALVAALLPLALLALGWWVVHRPGTLPPAAISLVPSGAYAALAIAALIGLAFHRGRIAYAALALAVGYAAWRRFVAGPASGFEAETVFAGLAVLGPVVLTALAWLEERGTFSVHALLRLGVIVGAAALVWWIVASGRAATTAWAYAPLAGTPTPFATPIPQLGLAAIAIALAAIAAGAFVYRSATVAGLGWALVALALGLHFAAAAPLGMPVFVATAGLALVAAVLQETYRLAFRDELTGLPSRRALNERLRALGRHYAVAMVDVDHFKRFNDTHGHDVGDQVLRMVAARLARVGGGGRAFRYGGEEFTVLFPGRGLDDAVPHLEAMRAQIEAYRMAIRRPDRPRKKRAGKRQRSSTSVARTFSVTVSIGAAEAGAKNDHPEAVVRAADRALYRAKRGGRNQLAV
jgi:diguanylate cyclase (GGDEF)-like protein